MLHRESQLASRLMHVEMFATICGRRHEQGPGRKHSAVRMMPGYLSRCEYGIDFYPTIVQRDCRADIAVVLAQHIELHKYWSELFAH